jgi:hypothetical protein
MSQSPEQPDREHAVMVQTYRVLSGVALLVIVLIEASGGLSVTLPLIVLFGLVGIVWRVPAAPGLVLFFYTVGQFFRSEYVRATGLRGQGAFVPDFPRVEMPDLVLAGAMITLFAAQYRLHGLLGNMLPFDARRRRRAGLGAQHQPARGEEIKRPRRSVSLYEAPTLVLTMPLWVLLGQILWLVIATRRGEYAFPPWVVRLITLVWLLGVPTLVVGSLMHLWYRSDMSPEEATLFLQDTQWRETAREQRRVSRFLAWARLRRKRREEVS